MSCPRLLLVFGLVGYANTVSLSRPGHFPLPPLSNKKYLIRGQPKVFNKSLFTRVLIMYDMCPGFCVSIEVNSNTFTSVKLFLLTHLAGLPSVEFHLRTHRRPLSVGFPFYI